MSEADPALYSPHVKFQFQSQCQERGRGVKEEGDGWMGERRREEGKPGRKRMEGVEEQGSLETYQQLARNIIVMSAIVMCLQSNQNKGTA